MRHTQHAGVVEMSDHDNRTALHIACAEGARETIEYLLGEGNASVNAEDRFGRRPLDDALVNGDRDIIQLLRACGAQLGNNGPINYTQKMIYAATRNDTDMIGLLHTAGVSVNGADYDGRTPLHLAVTHDNLAAVKLLVQLKADPYKEDRWGLTPLKQAKNQASRVGESPVWNVFVEHLRGQGVEVGRKYVQSFWIMYGTLWVLVIALLGVFGSYGEAAGGKVPVPGMPGLFATAAPAVEGPAPQADPLSVQELHDRFTDVYASFQDVHVMIFIGFGFLMSFLRHASYTAIGFTFLIGAFSSVVYQLWHALWLCAIGRECHGIVLDLNSILLGDFAAAAVLISFGVVIGNVSANQMLVCSVLCTGFYSLNERIAGHVYRATITDIGGTVLIHEFGAYFGLAFSFFVLPRKTQLDGKENNSSVYNSDINAMIGTLFLWLFWPSFNSAPADPGIGMNRYGCVCIASGGFLSVAKRG